MGTTNTVSPPESYRSAPTEQAPGWNPLVSIIFRFFFAYWVLDTLPLLLRFPVQMVAMTMSLASPGVESTPQWLSQGMQYLNYPGTWFQQGMNWFTQSVCHLFLNVAAEPPKDFTGSGDRLFSYCSAFGNLVLAIGVAIAWTGASLLWQWLRTGRRPNYDRMHAILRLIVQFHLMYQMIVYGAMKVWCAQFPPISDGQLEVKYGDSSPMGLLWRFMQFSQPYTSFTGIVEFTCGLLLISRRTTLLGALMSAAATLQVFMLNMCYDVPVKLMSGHLVLMALTLILPDWKRIFSFFVLGRPTALRPLVPIFGSWSWLNISAAILRTSLLTAFAGLSLFQAYKSALTQGIWAPPNPLHGRWVATEFLRDGVKVPFPEQPLDAPPKQTTPSKWKGGPGIPTVIRVSIAPMVVVFMFEDGSGVSYRNTSNNDSDLVLMSFQDSRSIGQLQATFPESDQLVLEGRLDGQDVRIALRKAVTQKKDYQLRNRGFNWIQDRPYNR